MVIGFDASRAFVEGRTGTENYSFQLLKNLAKIDQENTYTVYTRSAVPSAFVEQIAGWSRNFHFRQISWPRLWTQGGLSLQTFKDRLDILFVPAHTLPVFRKPGLKTVVTVHDLGSEYLPKMHQVKQRVYLSFMQRYQLKNVSKIIAVSKATKEDLVKRIGIESGKVSVVYEGFDKELFRPVKGGPLVSSLNCYGLDNLEYFLFVGTVQPRKNLERLMKAFARHTGEERLVIAGGKGWMSDRVYQLPKQLGIEERVKFLGYVPEKDLPALYSGAIALTLPSLFEGFGLPILEAQACGCSVLTSNIFSMPEVGGKGAAYVNPTDINDIVRGMDRLQATGYRLQLIKKGFENAKRFSWEKCARETLEVFKNLKL